MSDPHDHDHEHDDDDHAFGRDGWIREGLTAAMTGIGKVLLIMAVVTLGYLILRWAATEYYIATHCTEVLGTRVCQ